MKIIYTLGILPFVLCLTASAETVSFDKDKPGELPKGWQAGVTGRGSQSWATVASEGAPSRPNALRQSAKGDFPWAVKSDVSLADGYAEVKFKSVSGEDDQAGGVIWRFKDGNSYYVARGNALENNVSLYYTENGKREDAEVCRRSCGSEASGTRFARSSRANESKSYSTEKPISSSMTNTSQARAPWGCGLKPTASPSSTISITERSEERTMKWITRERPKIDRIACPWLIARFVDKSPEFLYVPKQDVMSVAKERDAIPYDVPGVELTHDGEFCSFDAFLKKYELRDPALAQLATIIRGADTDRLELAAQAPGLLAITLGLSHNIQDDHEMLKFGMVIYDALYSWCKVVPGREA